MLITLLRKKKDGSANTMENVNEKNSKLLEAEDLKKVKVFIAMPCHDGRIQSDTASSLLQTTAVGMSNGISLMIKFLNKDSLISRGRNHLVSMFMQTDCTHLMFIDSDMVFDSQAIYNLISKNRSVSCGAYSAKVGALNDATNVVKAVDENPEVDDYGMIEAKLAGTGFLCIKREVIEKMQEYYAHLHYDQDYDSNYLAEFDQLPDEDMETLKRNLYSLFDTSHCPDTNEYLSEDYTFCRRWRDMGGQIWLDCNINLGHVGTTMYVTDIRKALENTKEGTKPVENLNLATGPKPD